MNKYAKLRKINKLFLSSALFQCICLIKMANMANRQCHLVCYLGVYVLLLLFRCTCTVIVFLGVHVPLYVQLVAKLQSEWSMYMQLCTEIYLCYNIAVILFAVLLQLLQWQYCCYFCYNVDCYHYSIAVAYTFLTVLLLLLNSISITLFLLHYFCYIISGTVFLLQYYTL